MNIDVALNLLSFYNITIKQYLFCIALRNKDKELVEYFSIDKISQRDIDGLLQHSLLFTKKSPSTELRDYSLNEKQFEKLFNIPTASSFIEEWFDLWPKGVTSGNYYVRSDIKACEDKMNKFMKKYPKYTKEIIMNATSNYINRLKLDGYNYIKLATNFIEKERISVLAGECERIVESEVIKPQQELFGSREIRIRE